MENWEKALEDLKKVASGEYQAPEKVVLKLFCYKIDPRLENRRDCLMLTHKKGTPAPYKSKKGARPYLKAEVEIENLTKNGKKLLDVWTDGNPFSCYYTSVIKESEYPMPSEHGNAYRYNPREFFRTEQILIGESAADFINRLAERLEEQGRIEKQARIDRAERNRRQKDF